MLSEVKVRLMCGYKCQVLNWQDRVAHLVLILMLGSLSIELFSVGRTYE
jgi:hypothetical protein